MSALTSADIAYQNAAFIPQAETYPPRWAAAAAAFRTSLGPRAALDLPYGPGARQAFDFFHPESPAKGLMVYIHGGYWMAFDRKDWSHLAAGALAHGWAVAMPSYTLAPEARISAITLEIAQAIRTASAMVTGPVIVTGHSAGGHLAARMACADINLPIARSVPISPLADLAPLRHTAMNAKLRLSEDEATTESPANRALRPGVQTHIWVGGLERPAFLWQASTLSEAWTCSWTVAPGKHHFDVIDDLADPDSALVATCLALS